MGKIKRPSEEVLEYIKNNYSYVEGGTIDSPSKKNVGYLEKSKTRNFYRIEILNRQYRRAHLVWFLVYDEWPEIEIDHEDRDSTNDDIFNLRQVTPDIQNQNKDSYTGYRGFSIERTYETNRIRWQHYRVRNQKRKIHLGRFYTVEEAKEKIDSYWTERGMVGGFWDFGED